MRIIAILAAYNEERFIAGCIEHYARQGVEVYLINHGSTDQTVAIAERYWHQGLVGLEHFPRNEFYEWNFILKRKEALAATLEADWFIHADPDEIRLAPAGLTLAEAFKFVEQQGYNAVNFMEFTFIPVQESPDHNHPDFQQTMRWYYPFLPTFPHGLRAWQRQSHPVELAGSAGHRVYFPGLRMYPESFPMRHYQFLSMDHALTKYTNRKYLPSELQAGWHGWRAAIQPEQFFQLPPKADLREYRTDLELDASNPRQSHYLADILQAQSQGHSDPTERASRPVKGKSEKTERRPEILIIVDKPNWAHDYKTRNLQRRLGNDYHLVKRYQADVTPEDLDQADLIQVYYWMQVNKLPQLASAFNRNWHKVILGICSHLELEGHRREPGLSVLRQAQAVFANNAFLYHEFASLLNMPVFYTPNGVDTEFFQPGSAPRPSMPLRVGWAGSLTNQGAKQRGFYDLIVPAVNGVAGAELVTAIREDQWRNPAEMLDFYQSLDVYLCASRNDGTPNPCLEAAACGVPLVTTRVGNMPELIQHGVNGFFVEPEVEDIQAKLICLRDDNALRLRMSENIRQTIKAWDWNYQADNFRQVYRFVLNNQTSKETKAPRQAPQVVCVLGMHRSGTSLTARAINLLGVDLGVANQLAQSDQTNGAGFWEHPEITQLNDQLLAHLGGSWHQPPTFPPGWEGDPGLTDLRRQAQSLLEQFAGAELWGWKDPRTCLTLPFWQTLITQPISYILCLRNPIDVAAALEQRDGFTFEKSIQLWARYTQWALDSTASRPRHFVFYEDFFSDEQTLQSLARFLGKAHLAEEVQTREAIQRFLNADLHHAYPPASATTADPRLTFSVKALYAAMHFALSRPGQHPAEAQQTITRLVRQLADFQSDFDNLRRQADDWEKRALEREAHLALIYQSTSWRLTRPLRWVGDVLRGRNPGWLAEILKRIGRA